MAAIQPALSWELNYDQQDDEYSRALQGQCDGDMAPAGHKAEGSAAQLML